MSSDFTNIYLIHMYKLDLALDNLQGLICHKTKPKYQSKEKKNVFLSM